MAKVRKRQKAPKGPAPMIGRCRFCNAPFSSAYAAKSHVCRSADDDAKPGEAA